MFLTRPDFFHGSNTFTDSAVHVFIVGNFVISFFDLWNLALWCQQTHSEQDDLLRKQDKHCSGGVCLIPVSLTKQPGPRNRTRCHYRNLSRLPANSSVWLRRLRTRAQARWWRGGNNCTLSWGRHRLFAHCLCELSAVKPSTPDKRNASACHHEEHENDGRTWCHLSHLRLN